MKYRNILIELTAFICLAVTPPATAELTKTVVLSDYLGVTWQQELIHYPLEFSPGELKGEAVALVQPEGGKPIPCQVSDVVRHADRSLRSFNVWFIVNLPPDQSATYSITPGKAGPNDGGVAVKATDSAIEFTTKAPQPIGIRLVGGAKEYDPPVPATSVPGPIAALLLPSGREIGKGRFEVPFKVKSYQAEVTAAGPVFAEARIRYTFDTGFWTFTARVVRGCPMVIINEEVDTGDGGQAWDTADRFYVLPLNTGGFKPTQGWYTGRTDTEGFHDLMNQYVQPVLTNGLERGGPGSTVNGYTLTFKENRTDYYLTPWPTWSARAGVAMRLVEPGKDAIGFASIKTTDWRNPLAARLRTDTNGELSMALPLQVYRQGWPSEGFGAGSPNYTGKTLGVPPTTVRRNYGIMLTAAEDEQKSHIDGLLYQTARLGAQPLDEVKNWTLDWPDPLSNATWAAESSKVGKEALAVMRTWLAAKRALGNYASYSMWTYYSLERTRYDKLVAVFDQPKELSAIDRRDLRRLCAFQAYVMNSLDEFPWGSGPHIGNPNMHMMAMAARAHTAYLVKDHPQFKEWGQWTLDYTRDFITRYTRQSGAPYECPHYTLDVTISDITKLNKTLLETGVGDALDTPLFKACMQVLLDWSMPADPRFTNHRLRLAFGNGYPYESFTVPVMQYLVEYYQTRDPQLAAQLQWVVNRSQPDDKQIHVVRDEAPALRSRSIGDLGVIFRHGFGTPYETFMFLMAGNCDGHYEAETEQMAYTLYAKGQPINLHFGNGYLPMFVRPWLRNRVSFDHMIEESERNPTRVQATAFTPEAEYVRAARDVDSLRPLNTEYPITTNRGAASAPAEQASWPALPHWQRTPLTTWYRQMLFLKDVDPKGPNYFVLRDTFDGAPSQPTDLSLWFLASNMTRQGDLYHFDGQGKVDMDVFVAAPVATEPETGQYGHPSPLHVRPVATDTNFFLNGKSDQETQLFLRLKQPAGKGYLVVLYPRLKENDPPASFTTLAEGVVRMETPLSTDYAFLNPAAFEFKDARVQFRGVSGTVRFYKSGKIAIVNTEGQSEIRIAGHQIAGTGPFTVLIELGKVVTQTHAPDARVEAK